ncbi:MAG TPA: cell division protein FtsZ [Candidatus Bathyarchaeia archaeon]|nr:cell division protein FtsZ [Candidatus Bathyarchaeia archaeon]
MEKSAKVFQINHRLSEATSSAQSDQSDQAVTLIHFFRFIGGNASETEEMVKQLQALKRKKGLLLGMFRFPFRYEGKKRLQIAIHQYTLMKQICDSVTYFYGDGMMDMLEPGTTVKDANEIFYLLEEAVVDTLEEMICIPGEMNIDVHDIQTFLTANKGPFFLHSFEGNSFDEPLKHFISTPYLPLDFADGQHMIISIGYTRDVDMESFRQINLRLNDLFHKADLFKIGSRYIDEPGQRIKITLLVNGLADPFPLSDDMKPNKLPAFSLHKKWRPKLLLGKKLKWLSPLLKHIDS